MAIDKWQFHWTKMMTSMMLGNSTETRLAKWLGPKIVTPKSTCLGYHVLMKFAIGRHVLLHK